MNVLQREHGNRLTCSLRKNIGFAGDSLQTVGGSQVLLHIVCGESYRHFVGVHVEIRTCTGHISIGLH